VLALAVFVTPYPWFAVTLAVSCLGAGAVIGTTVGRRLAAKPDPLGVLMVAAIAVAVGDLIAAPLLALDLAVDMRPVNLVEFWAGGLVVLGIPAFFFLAFPAVTIGILLARRLTAGRGLSR
jgi:hypothetical protein